MLASISRRLFGSMLATLALAPAVAFAQPAAHPAMPRIHIDGAHFVDPDGKVVTLKGCNLGNWLLIEPGVFNGAAGRFDDQDTLFQTLRDRFGEPERRRLISVYRDNFIAARDFDNVAKFKFNLVRIGFDYDLMEDDDAPMKLRDDAFKYLDFAVAQAKQRGIYVLFDLHGAPGRTENGKQSGRNGPAEFWDNAQDQQRALWLWTEVAKHFRGDTTVLGYEALNEPWGKSPAALREFCERWYPAIRAVDPDAVTCFPGWKSDLKFYGNPKDNGWTNAIFDMHFYPGLFGRTPPTLQTNINFYNRGLTGWIDYMRQVNTPLLVGEINVVYKSAGGGEMLRRYYDRFAEQGWAVTYWTLKELQPKGGVTDAMWKLTTNAQDLKTVDINTSSKEDIEAFFRSLSTIPLATDDDVLHWMTTDQKPSPLPTSQPTTR